MPPPNPDSALLTRNVCVDASQYVRSRYGFHTREFQRLLFLAAHGAVRLVITEVIRREVEANIALEATAISEAIEKMQRAASPLRATTHPAAGRLLGATVDAASVSQQLRDAFARYLHAAQAVEVPSDGADLGPVLDAYFGGRAPFGTGKKKAEFPDALTVAALDRWCRERGEMVYVITQDGVPDAPRIAKAPLGADTSRSGLPDVPTPGHPSQSAPTQAAASEAAPSGASPARTGASLTSACLETTSLIPLPHLATFIALVTRSEAEREANGPKRANRLARLDGAVAWYHAHRDDVRRAFLDDFGSLDFRPDDQGEDAEVVRAVRAHLSDPQVTDIGPDWATLGLRGRVWFATDPAAAWSMNGVWADDDPARVFDGAVGTGLPASVDVPVEIILNVPTTYRGANAASPPEVAAQSTLRSLRITARSIAVPTRRHLTYDEDWPEPGR